MEFSKTLKDLRVARGVSQKAVADALDVNQTTISSWELGKKSPTANSLKALAKYFEVSIDYLMGMAEDI